MPIKKNVEVRFKTTKHGKSTSKLFNLIDASSEVLAMMARVYNLMFVLRHKSTMIRKQSLLTVISRLVNKKEKDG